MKLRRNILVIIVFVIMILLVRSRETEFQRLERITKERYRIETENEKKEVKVEEVSNIFGDKNSEISVVEFSRFGCPHCFNFHKETFPQIKKEYLDTNKIKYEIKIMIDLTDGNDLLGVVLPSCVKDESQKHLLISKLFENTDWLKFKKDEIEKKIAVLREIFLSVLDDENEFKECIKNVAIANTLIKKEREDIKAYNIKATPTFIINGNDFSGDMGYKEFKEIIDKMTQDDK
ncbi:MAG: DsbA family protein [Rickettsiales bacterium]|jgi:protein-disulfide isomerase|nr:DsbA family protein [Rickettsiales bacterium]